MSLLQFQQRNKQTRQQNEMSERELALREQQLAQQGFASERDFGLREQQLAQQGTLSGQDIDLRKQDMLQRLQQLQTEQAWQKEQVAKRDQQWEAEMQDKTLSRAMEQSRFAQTNPVQEAYMKAQTAKMLRPEVDLRAEMMGKEGALDRQAKALELLIPMESQPIERQKLIDRLKEILNIQLRADTPEEARQRAAYGGQPQQ